MAEDYGYDLIKTIVLASTGVFILYYINRLFELRNMPIVLGGKTPETATQKLSINIPEFWIPYQPGDSKDSVARKFTPDITIEGSSWVLTFKPIKATVVGITTTYTPNPVKIPITSTITIAELATRIVPIITSTSNPVGWNVKFSPITILA